MLKRSENFSNEEKNFSTSFNSNKKDWTYRNGRNGIIKSSYLSEDDLLFREHLEQMEKKQSNRWYDDKEIFKGNLNLFSILKYWYAKAFEFS